MGRVLVMLPLSPGGCRRGSTMLPMTGPMLHLAHLLAAYLERGQVALVGGIAAIDAGPPIHVIRHEQADDVGHGALDDELSRRIVIVSDDPVLVVGLQLEAIAAHSIELPADLDHLARAVARRHDACDHLAGLHVL